RSSDLICLMREKDLGESRHGEGIDHASYESKQCQQRDGWAKLCFHEKTPETTSNVHAMVNMKTHGRKGTGICNVFGAILAAASPTVERMPAILERGSFVFILYS